MATKRRKVRKSRRRSCKHGKLKRPIRTRKGGKRRCRKSKRKSKKRKYKMRYNNLPRDVKLELIDRMSIKELLNFSKTSRENNALVKTRIIIIRNDLANNGFTPQEMNEILEDEDNFFDLVNFNRINKVRVILKYFPEYINIIDFTNNTPLLYAVHRNHTEIARILLNAGADLNFQNTVGFTALMFASLNGNQQIIRMLLDAGAQLEMKDESGKTALMYARQNGNQQIIDLLLQYGAKQ